ncbi:MAG: pyridoxine 5'-phosphate synthase [Legionellales bacterium]|nr:pyridoxine 5'-phosphate synthase [Legionellales bacterium]|tara:strand:+ start:532 stop:1251 length:720 start_codon:yes stop_codon:yes gene_type:complete
MRHIYLGVNVDHVGTVRNARGTHYPSPVEVALLAEEAGADGITMHLREDRRHIVDKDVFEYAQKGRTRLNFEMAMTDEMLEIALKVKPATVCLVPEKREELTTEGGLDVITHFARVKAFVTQLQSSGINVSLFIDPDQNQIEASAKTKAKIIELHTGDYAENASSSELEKICNGAKFASDCGLIVNAGHGLTLENVLGIAKIPQINELNIGHSIVARSITVGFVKAVQEMKAQMMKAVS